MRPLFEILGRTPAWEPALIPHGLAAWVADELAGAGKPVPPALQQAARAQLSSGLKIKRLTLMVLDALRAADVVPVLLKGYGLAARLFPEQPLARPASDVDVLVLPSELARAEQALAKLGLQHRQVPGVADEHEEHHHRAWSGPAGLVEVHFRLFSGFGGNVFADDELRRRCVSAQLDGRDVRWLSGEDEFLYLAVHAANHGFLRASWLVDLRQYLVRYPALDWAVIRARAARAGFLIPLVTTLGLLEHLLEVELPPEARRQLRPSRWRALVDPRVFSAERVADARWSNDRVASFLLRLYLVDSPGQGLRHVFEGARRYWRQRREG